MTKQFVVNADVIDWMKKQPSSIYNLIVADPPYNVGKNYGVMVDSTNKEEYLCFLREWTKEASRLLKPYGTIYVFMGFRFISCLYSVLENECELFFNGWICWHYTQGQGRKRGFSTRHDDILMFTKDEKNFTFNLDDIRVPQKYYRSVNNMRGANPGDVWEFSHVHYCQGNRQAHPTQKPEGLVERMVLASSSDGDNVLDLFSGSGTTLRVCQQLSRNCTGVEINPEYTKIIETRLNQPFNGFDSIDPKMKRVPFDLCDFDIRKDYVENHKRWFLKHHANDIADFEKEVFRLYGGTKTKGKMRINNGKTNNKDLLDFIT